MLSFMGQLGIGRKCRALIMQTSWLWKEHDKRHFVQLTPCCPVPSGSSDPGKEQAVCQGGDSSHWNRSSDRLWSRFVRPASSSYTAHRVGAANQSCMTWCDFFLSCFCLSIGVIKCTHNSCLKKAQRVPVKYMGVQFLAEVSMMLNVTEN